MVFTSWVIDPTVVIKVGKAMSLEERAKAIAQNIEGKLQEAAGDITGNTQDQATGKTKQAAAQVRNVKENLKDTLKRHLDRL